MEIDAKGMTRAITLILLFTAITISSIAQDKFDKAGFYQTMSAGDVSAIDNELTIVQNSSPENKAGYEGALLMKKAGLVAIAAKKLKYFKAGRTMLETALLNDPNNIEYHFLRLAIQEHAPKIVKYYKDIAADKINIQKNYKNSQPVIQHAILDYSKKSKVLHAEEL